AEEAGIKNATNFLLPPPAGLKSRFDVGLRQLDKVSTLYLSCYNIDDPEYSEPGTCVLTFLTGKTTSPFVDLPPEDYFDAKFNYASLMIDYLKDFYPDVEDHIEEIEVFSPMTLMRYIGSPQGAIYGVDGYMKDLLANKLEARSPFSGLYFCGSSLMFGGFHTTLISGYTAAKLILKDLADGIIHTNHNFIGMNKLGQILTELNTSQKYNIDHRANKGKIRRDVERLHPEKIEFKVTEMRQETASTKTIRLTPTEGYVPPFIPGQYINLSVLVGGILTSRPYSISSPSTERAFYEITVKRTAEGFVSDYLLDQLQVGDILNSNGPSGLFYRFDRIHGKKLCLIAGGSGITPFMSMLATDAAKLRDDQEICLIYGSAKEDDIVFADKLKALEATELPGFRLVPVISEPDPGCQQRTGFITAELIAEVLGNPLDYTFFVCGPQVMYDFVLPELDKLGIPKRRIRVEVPSAPKHPSQMPGWPEGLNEEKTFTIALDDGRSIPAKAGDNILFSLEKAGITKTNSCRGGECATCRLRVIEGQVFNPGLAKMRKSDMRYGYIHPCVTYPLSDLKVIVM
ncbi:MAG: 2Fe-2S iron-sulfur cluster binding domain-containing protein, partial [Coriobacteriales bacterium]|nr:2Fe-2S iron-sulfur cluster binding domain-containing protein [Coriobacteriales bacterium]